MSSPFSGSTSSTAQLAGFVAALRQDELPPTVVTRLAQCLLDFVAVSAAGRQEAESSTAIIDAVARFTAPAGPSTVIGVHRRYPARDAALLNGTFAHSLDFDDTNIPSGLHPGAPVIATALAAAECEDADGAEFLTALAAGYEVCCRVGVGLGRGAYERGFHPTAIAGLFGAVAAGARLRNLPADEVNSAFGVAGSMAAGSMQYLESGAWNKRLHPGLAAHNAIMALDLVATGFRGAEFVLEGGSGLLAGYTTTPNLGAITDGLGRHWVLADTGIKPYPACRLTHGAIDAALRLRTRLGPHIPADARFALRISPAAEMIVGGNDSLKIQPRNSVDAQFSIYFQTAVALLDGEVTWSSYDQIGSARIASLIDRIELSTGDDITDAGAALSCQTNGADIGEIRIDTPSGEPSEDLPWDFVEAKYHGLVAGWLEEGMRKEVLAWVKTLPHHEPVHALTDLLRS